MSSPDRTHENEMARARMAYRKITHHCARCNAQDAYTLAGRSCCAECAAKMSAEKMKKYWERGGNPPGYNERKTALRRKWEQDGLCTHCGKRPALAGKKRCVECTAYYRRYKERRRIESGRTLEQRLWRKEHGFCWICGKPVADIEKPWSGENVKLCADHYQMACECAKIGSKAYLEKYGKSWARHTKDRLWPHKTQGSRWTDGTQPKRPE